MSVIDYNWDFSKEEFSFDLDFFNEKEQEDKMWQARTGYNMETLCGAIETIIFMSDRPVNIMKIKNQIDSDLPLRVIHECLSRLQAEYELKHHGIRLQEVAEGYQFRTKATYSKVVQKMFNVQSLTLSPTAMEVLAIIAYKQPISKNGVETIRGVDSSHIIRGLMDKRLVKVVGRTEEIGKPSAYGTTSEFMEVFNLKDITELPTESELEELAESNSVGNIHDIKDIVNSQTKVSFEFDEFQELEELQESIKDISVDTTFTKELMLQDKKRRSDDGEVKKSAFDILEEYLDRHQTIEQNKESIDSDVLMSFMNPRTVNLLMEEGLINAPEIDEEEELEALNDRELPELKELSDVDHAFEKLDLQEEKSEEALLADELDAAFDNLFGESGLDEADLEMSQEDEAKLEREIEGISSKTKEIADKAKDLDLDLDFLDS
jgi:segregation and condensation protein B